MNKGNTLREIQKKYTSLRSVKYSGTRPSISLRFVGAYFHRISTVFLTYTLQRKLFSSIARIVQSTPSR